MCKGLAIGISKNMKITCKGLSSHTESGIDNGKHYKMELIINDNKKECSELWEDRDNDNVMFKEFVTING